jgi:hypothetical protein
MAADRDAHRRAGSSEEGGDVERHREVGGGLALDLHGRLEPLSHG